MDHTAVLEVLKMQIMANAAISDLTDEEWGLMQELAAKVDCPLPERVKAE
jgi:hypothetical protein